MKGSELDKQIYKEGEPTWGCKSGVLDVEGVKKFFEDISKYPDEEHKRLLAEGWTDEDALPDCGEFLNFIKEKLGPKLIGGKKNETI